MYTVEVDLHLQFTPPMDDLGKGVTFRRRFLLPFPPSPKVAIHSKHADDCPDPLGMCLTDIVWDIDREVFLAKTTISMVGEPLAVIPGMILDWMDRGWELGSWLDQYQVAEPTTNGTDAAVNDGEDDSEWDRLERMHTLPKRERPRWFNRFFQALIRHMVEHHDGCAEAYTMDRLGRWLEVYDDRRINPTKTRPSEEAEWLRVRDEYGELSEAALDAWERKVSRYPRMAKVLQEIREEWVADRSA